MVNSNFIQKSKLFSYNSTACLRNEYYFNSCQNCVDLCPKEAFNIVRNKLTLFENECIECAACIGSCPSEALSIKTFDPNEYTQNISTCKEEMISCKKSTPCLGVFDTHHYISMALLKSEELECDLSHCSECKLDSESKISDAINAKIDEANRFLSDIGVEQKINKKYEKEEILEKRMIFKKIVNSVTSEQKEFTLTQSYQHDKSNTVPLKNVILKESIKSSLDKIKRTSFDMNDYELFFNKEIEFGKCTNCGECTQFCPTKALFATKDKQGIVFQESACIGCEICNHICKTSAITTLHNIDLVEIAYDRAKELVHYEMVMCHECRTPYAYRGGDPICDRCEGFLKESPNMFALAKDI